MRIKLKIYRFKSGLTQEQVAKKVGISEQCYSYIENGKRNTTLENWHKIQDVLNISDNDMWEVMSKNKE